MKQGKDDLEDWWSTEDAWGYKTNPDDQRRKDIVLRYLKKYKFGKALDIGAGEGWITKDLPADEIHGFELSDKAASRFPANVKRVEKVMEDYDLIVACGVMYKQYDYWKFIDIIEHHALGIVLLCNIKDWEVPDIEQWSKWQIDEFEFPYREYTQKLRIYDFTAS